MALGDGISGGGSSSSTASTTTDGVVRGEFQDRSGRLTFVAVRRLRWGTQVFSEKPLLLVEADPDVYLRAEGADPRLLELASALGDPQRLAAYVAFKQLHERKQKDVLALWREGIEASDSLARRHAELNRRGVDMFVKDRPEFARLVNWQQFVLIAAIFGRFGMRNPDGSRAVYMLCSQLRHSCRPNAAWFTLRKGFPKGRKQLHIIAVEGLPRGEEITISEEPEEILVLPKVDRAKRLFGGSGLSCPCSRCAEEEADDGEAPIGPLLSKLQTLLGVRPPTDESTAEALQCMKELDRRLPFSMQIKAKAKVLLASALSELSQRAAWQEESRGANIIRWTGLDAESQEQRLRDTKKLYETAAKDFELLLGQDALGILERLEASYAPVSDQHKMLAKYTRDHPPPSAPGAAPGGSPGAPGVAAAPGAPGAGAGGYPAGDPGESGGGGGGGRGGAVAGREALPPGWDELFPR